MLKNVFRAMNLISYDQIQQVAVDCISEYEADRSEIRKTCLDEIENLNPLQDGEKIQRLLIQMNRDITALYEKETVLRDFLNKVNL